MSVVVTGIGVVSSRGAGYDALRTAAEGDGLPLTEVDRSAGHHREPGPTSSRHAALVPDDATSSLPPMKARRMSRPTRFAVVASRLALEGAGLDPDALSGSELSAGTGVSLGTAFGATMVSRQILDQCIELGPGGISPFLFPESVPSAHAGQVALALGARGPNAAISQGEASLELALAVAAEYLVTGRAERMLVGAANEADTVLHALLDRAGALAGAGEDGAGRARPLDRRRNGMLLTEGATVALLEREDVATGRGARTLARLTGWVRAFDPSAPPGDWGTGAAPLARRLRGELERLGTPLGAIGGVVSGASGSRRGDALEAQILNATFGADLPPVCTPKGSCGEYSGFSLAATLHLLAGGRLAGGDFEPDPALGVVPASSLGADAPSVLASALASGGPAAWLVWERP